MADNAGETIGQTFIWVEAMGNWRKQWGAKRLEAMEAGNRRQQLKQAAILIR